MRIKFFSCVLILLMFSVILSYGQGLPCVDTDPDATCPLDTWVLILAAGASIFAVMHLSRKQKSAAV